jgi:signal transduction histidine kinase
MMLERIEHLVVGLTTITDSLAHDLRTPLSRLKHFLEAGMDSDDPKDKDRALESALQQSNQIVSTFSALIDIARANGGLSRDAMEPLELRALLSDVQTLFEPLAEERGGRLQLDAPEPIKMIGHKALLMQAVSNLVDNAIKHAPEGTDVKIALRQSSGNAEIVVMDNGAGITVIDRDELLKRFTQADNEPPGGIGLGLAIAKACAVLHQGSIWLEDNNPGLKVRLVLSRS